MRYRISLKLIKTNNFLDFVFIIFSEKYFANWKESQEEKKKSGGTAFQSYRKTEAYGKCMGATLPYTVIKSSKIPTVGKSLMSLSSEFKP